MDPVPSRSQGTKLKSSDGPPRTGFSLLEMMTVLALLLIFASFALPTYQNIVLRTREAALRDDLYTLRSMIDRFTLDKQCSQRLSGAFNPACRPPRRQGWQHDKPRLA